MEDLCTPVKRFLKTTLKVSENTPIKLPASPFLKTLGYGTGVGVFRLERSPKVGKVRSPWALKYVTKARYEQQNKELEYETRLHSEAALLRKLNHPNIVGFRCLINKEDGRKVLAMEDCEHSLGDMIEEKYENNPGPFKADHILKVAYDVSLGLEYLHDTAKLLHGDIKSYNILIKGNFVICKICDFGVSLPVDSNGYVDTEKSGGVSYIGTEIWSAPETINCTEKIGIKADIFSFGLTLWEMLSLIPPNNPDCSDSLDDSNISPSEDSIINLDDTVDNFMDGLGECGKRPPLPDVEFDESYNPILELFHIMTEQATEMRPLAKHVVNYIENLNSVI